MGYAPPLIRPPLPPLRPPTAPPYRPPVLAPPPTQIDPEYEPPTLLPPTDIDLKGIVCIYSNAPIWEPKKIRYRYPGEENWQEIAGENYSVQINNLGWENLPLVRYKVNFIAESWNWNLKGDLLQFSQLITGGFKLVTFMEPEVGQIRVFGNFVAYLGRKRFELWDRNGTSGNSLFFQNQVINEFNDYPKTSPFYEVRFVIDYMAKLNSIKVVSVVRISDNQEIPPTTNCTFKVFNIFNQEILSITRDDCPEVIVVPERCYFQDENEKLVRKINIGFFQDLEIKYNGNCATVFLKSYPLPLPVEIYKECSDNPNCPPPRIRFDKKCEEKCEQCPPGTAIKVLLGNRIACVDAVGCVLKSIKYKPGCNNYDCICS